MNPVEAFADRLQSLSSARLFWAIFALAIAVRVSLLVLFHPPAEVQFAEMDKIARSLATHGTFADAYFLPTGPTAHHAPAYPFLLSFVFRMFGYGSAAVLATAVMNFALASVQYALMPVLADWADIPRSVGVTTGLIGAVLPYRLLKEIRWDATLAAAASVVLVLLTTRWWRTREPSPLATLLLGLAWGIGMMCSANLLVVFLVFVLLFAIAAHRLERPRSWPLILMLSAGVLLAIAPWTIRNYRELHAVMFMRSNFGLEFSLSNNPDAHVLGVDNDTIGFTNTYFQRHHPGINRGEAEEILRVGEAAYNRALLHRTMDWIRANPRQFMELTLSRIAYFWFPPYRTQVWKNFLLTPWTILAACGLWVMIRRQRELGLLMLALWVGFPMVHYLIQMDTRYRYPIDWTFALLAVFAVHAFRHRGRVDDFARGAPDAA
jgi:uncharacterized membrane protein (UPF0136 family)